VGVARPYMLELLKEQSNVLADGAEDEVILIAVPPAVVNELYDTVPKRAVEIFRHLPVPLVVRSQLVMTNTYELLVDVIKALLPPAQVTLRLSRYNCVVVVLVVPLFVIVIKSAVVGEYAVVYNPFFKYTRMP
jgi:hypothetical protein